jgi:hypothetical protein
LRNLDAGSKNRELETKVIPANFVSTVFFHRFKQQPLRKKEKKAENNGTNEQTQMNKESISLPQIVSQWELVGQQSQR